MDDVLVHAGTPELLSKLVESFLKACKQRGPETESMQVRIRLLLCIILWFHYICRGRMGRLSQLCCPYIHAQDHIRRLLNKGCSWFQLNEKYHSVFRTAYFLAPCFIGKPVPTLQITIEKQSSKWTYFGMGGIAKCSFYITYFSNKSSWLPMHPQYGLVCLQTPPSLI